MRELKMAFNPRSVLKRGLPILTLLLLSIVVFGPLINQLGYYNEDWYHLLFISREGPESLISLYSGDRPFMGWLNYYDYQLVGIDLLSWNIYALICRFFIGLGVFWIMRLVWPKQSLAGFAVGVLVLVYPGFLSQPHAMNYKNYLFEFSLALFSIAFSIKWIQARKLLHKVAFWLLSMIFAGGYMLIYEFMIGLEATRIFILAYIFLRTSGGAWKKTILETTKYSASYLVVTAVFVYWRFFVFSSSRAMLSEGALISSLVSSPTRSLLRIVLETGKDLFDSVVFAWSVPSYQLIGPAYYRELGEAAIFVILAVGLFIGYIWVECKETSGSDESEDMSSTFIFLGFLSTVFSILTIVIPGRDIQFNGFERYSLHATFGIGLLTVGILSKLPRKYFIGILVVMVGLSTTTHYLNANRMKKNWAGYQDFWWQVSWRIPQFEGGTMVVVDYPPDSRAEQDYEIFSPLNIIYPDAESMINAEVLNVSTVRWIEAGVTKNDMLREVPLKKDFSSTLVLSIPSAQACLHVHDGDHLALSEHENIYIRAAAPYSSIGQIKLNSEFHVPPEEIFGPEPEHDWCYYYQKAAFARQLGDWENIMALYEEAKAKDLRARDRVEWIPFFEAFAILGRNEKAFEIAEIFKAAPNIAPELCSGLYASTDFISENNLDKIHELLCP